MSRSYKHTAYSGDKKDKFFKKYANKRLRQKKLQHDYKYRSYKKDFCSYDICDYYWLAPSFEKFYIFQLQSWYTSWSRNIDKKPTRRGCWDFYQKYYIRK